MICPICFTHMKTTNKISSDKSPIEIRRYVCNKGHTYISQEELLDEQELEILREKDS